MNGVGEPRGQEAGCAGEAADGQGSRRDEGVMTRWQPGDRIALEYTDDPHTRLRPGDEGTVTRWDPAQGQLDVRWDSGSTLSMLLNDGDRVRLVTPRPRRRAGGSREGAGPVSAPSPQPAAVEAALRQAGDLGRRHLAPGAEDETGDGTEPEDGEAAPDWRQDISDPATGLSRLLSERCPTCILRVVDCT